MIFSVLQIILVFYFFAFLDKPSLVYPKNVIEFCAGKMASPNDDDKSPFLIAFLVEYNFIKAKEIKKELNQKSENLKSEMISLVENSIEMLNSLSQKYDTIRQKYWNYLISKWKQEFLEYL